MARYNGCKITYDCILYQYVWENIFNNVLLESLILVDCVIWGRNKYEDKESRNPFVEWSLSCFVKSILSYFIKSPRRITYFFLRKACVIVHQGSNR